MNADKRAQGLVVRFVDRASLDAYGPHRAVVETHIAPIREDTLAFDREIAPRT